LEGRLKAERRVRSNPRPEKLTITPHIFMQKMPTVEQ
jgi:hypothetical protein